MVKALVTGGHGKLAQALAASAPSGWTIVSLPRAALDITSEAAVRAAVAGHAPDLVLNCAAYNHVDAAESNSAEVFEVNASGPRHLAEACAARGIRMVHFSTDFVFDGNKATPYAENDTPGPLNVYGRSKLGGEREVLTNSDHLVVRVSRLFGPDASGGLAGNFPALLRKLALEGRKVSIVDGYVATPTYTRDLAPAVWSLALDRRRGLFHLTNGGKASLPDYARAILEFGRLDCQIEIVPPEAFGAKARRPAYSVLDNAKAHSAGVAPLRHWRKALSVHLQAEARHWQDGQSPS